MLRVPCVHLFPLVIDKLRPLEERFLAIGCAFGTITKFSLDPTTNQPSDQAYRKISGHVVVFANDVFSVAKVLPRPIQDVLGDIHVIWCAPDAPVKKDLLPVLGLRKSVMMEALLWLKRNNHLYFDVPLDDDFWNTWTDEDDIVLPQILSNVTHIEDVEAEAADRATYVPSQGHDPVFDDLVSDNNIRPGSNPNIPVHLANAVDVNEQPYTELEEEDADNDLEEQEFARSFHNMDHLDHTSQDEPSVPAADEVQSNPLIDQDNNSTEDAEVETHLKITSSGFFPEQADQANDAEKVQFVLESIRSEFRQPFSDEVQGGSIIPESIDGKPYVRVSLGNRFLSTQNPHYFASVFLKLFPYGWGGPVASDLDQRQELDRHNETNFGLKTWASIKLRQHGAMAATHPVFPFLVFSRIIKDNNNRISCAQANKSSFEHMRRICNTITQEQLLQAASDLKHHIAAFIRWVDEHFQEDFNETISKKRIRKSKRLRPPENLQHNLDQLELEWEDEAEFVATAAQAHRCTATCYKYDKVNKPKKRKRGLRPARRYRFGFPWKTNEFTHLSEDGTLHIKRLTNHYTR
ncbi:hypothetical protein F4781DRAFT_441758 [Annulohypoxylon bovei var. microspora]|nr:hypothetical protein F4781DRAFT_441758 [Annulohypoxylon bovei var. microspora]